MKRHKTFVTSCLLVLALAGIASGAVLVMNTMRTYDGACEKLDGFPGLMQGAGLLARGNCSVIPLQKCANQPCTVGGKAGHCVARQVDENSREGKDNKKHCVCVAKHISK